MDATTFKYAIFQDEAGAWFFSLAEDLSDPSDSFETREQTEEAVSDLLTAALKETVLASLFGVAS